MSPADNTPDFDSMSPEEMMAWMETLAKRQGVDNETLTTSADLSIEEIDPDSVEVEDNYIPYGMTEEEWAVKKAEEDAERAAKLANQQAAAPPPVPEPATPEPVAAAEPEPAAQPAAEAGGEPDFDSMSPEEMMAWMESLAKRQGVDSEQLTTAADVSIAEIDPNTVEVEDNYIPYGMTEEEWAVKKAEEDAERAAKLANQQAVPTPEPVADVPDLELPDLGQPLDLEGETEIAATVEDGGMDWLQDAAPEQVEMDLSSLGEEIGELPDMEMDLSGLGEELGEIDLGMDLDSLDLDGLDDLAAQLDVPDLEVADAEPEAAVEADSMDWLDAAAPADEPVATEDPMDWLDSLTGEQEDQPFDLPTDEPTAIVDEDTSPVAEASGIADPTEADVDPIEWLESLAKEQGASEDEFITDAGLEIPTSTEAGEATGGYTDYTFEDADASDEVELPELNAVDAIDALDASDPDDPVAWLEGLASSQGGDTTFDIDDDDDFIEEIDDIEADLPAEEPVAEATDPDIINRLNQAEDVSAQDMESWMANLLEQGATREDAPPDYVDVEEEDEPVIEANIPDWLIDQVGPPPEMDAVEEEVEEPEPEAAEAELDPELEALFDVGAEELEDAPEIPDWIGDDGDDVAEEVDVPDWLQEHAEVQEADEPIFVEEEPATVPAIAGSSDDSVDSTDPWVEAFEIEREQNLKDTDSVPTWYAEALGMEVPADAPTDESPAQVEPAPTPTPAAASLQSANLAPETILSAGEPEAVPDWLGDAAAALPAPEPVPTLEPQHEATWLESDEMAVVGDGVPDWLADESGDQPFVDDGEDIEIPAWLSEANLEKTDTVPDWLLETVDGGAQPPTEVPPTPAPTPAPAPQPEPVAQSPAPPVPVADIDVVETLQSAKTKVEGGDVDGALQDYEAIVLANSELETVVDDLSKLVKQDAYKEKAPVHRVLGDGLMRLGRLQEALDTYRRALNLL